MNSVLISFSLLSKDMFILERTQQSARFPLFCPQTLDFFCQMDSSKYQFFSLFTFRSHCASITRHLLKIAIMKRTCKYKYNCAFCMRHGYEGYFTKVKHFLWGIKTMMHSRLKMEEHGNKELLDKCERGNIIASLWHKCQAK